MGASVIPRSMSKMRRPTAANKLVAIDRCWLLLAATAAGCWLWAATVGKIARAWRRKTARRDMRVLVAAAQSKLVRCAHSACRVRVCIEAAVANLSRSSAL